MYINQLIQFLKPTGFSSYFFKRIENTRMQGRITMVCEDSLQHNESSTPSFIQLCCKEFSFSSTLVDKTTRLLTVVG